MNEESPAVRRENVKLHRTTTLTTTTTNPSTAVVQCALCSRWGRWDWRQNVVRHGRDGKVVCVLPEPARKRST